MSAPTPSTTAPSTTAPSTAARTRPARRLTTVVIAVVGAVALLTTGCSDDEGSEESSSTTTESTAESVEETTAPESEEEGAETTADYDEAIAATDAALEAAEEPCQVLDAVNQMSGVKDPETTEETKTAVETYVLFLSTVARFADAGQQETFTQGAAAIQSFAEENGYDAEAMDFGGEGPAIPEWADLQTALDAFYTAKLAGCAGAAAPDTGGAPTSTP